MGCLAFGCRVTEGGPNGPDSAPPSDATAGRCHVEWQMPNAPSSGLPNPQSYDPSLAGTVLDRVTGLLWQRAVDPNSYNWTAANAYCAGLGVAGYRDWRLPSVVELVSIVDISRANPAIDPTAFPDTPMLSFWSSQAEVSNSGLGWYIYFATGGAYGGNDLADPQRVRCVRAPSAAKAGSDCYTVANGAVYDANTKLTWQQAADTRSYAWADAVSHCAGFGTDGSAWRLPSFNELMTLVDFGRVDPALDSALFLNTGSDFFWSSSPGVGSSGTAWGVSFSKGSSGASLAASAARARCVR